MTLSKFSILGIVFVFAIRAGAQGCPSSAPTNCPNYTQVNYFNGTQVVNPMIPSATVSVLIQTNTPLTQSTVVQSIDNELDNVFDVLNNAGASLSRSSTSTSYYIPFYNSVNLITPNQVAQFANNFAAGQYPGTVQATVANPQFLYISGPTANMCTAPVNMCTYPVPSTLPQDNNAEIAEVTVVNNQLLPCDPLNPSACASNNLVTDYPQAQLEDVLGTEDSHSVLDVTDCSGANCANTMANPVANTNTTPTQCDLLELYVLSGRTYGCPPPAPPPPPPPPAPPAPSGGSSGVGGGGGGSGGGDNSISIGYSAIDLAAQWEWMEAYDATYVVQSNIVPGYYSVVDDGATFYEPGGDGGGGGGGGGEGGCGSNSDDFCYCY